MLDFKNDATFPFRTSSESFFKEKMKLLVKKQMTSKAARGASFFSLASVLGACNFGGSSSVDPINLSAIKGPLKEALAFVDRDGDGVFDDGEEFAITGSDGSATINPDSDIGSDVKFVITSIGAGQTIGGVTYSTGTVDSNTGGVVKDLVLKAPSTATVVTPVTTIMAETTLTEAEVKEVLGLPAAMDILSFNPFEENLSAADQAIALEAEKVALKVYTTVSTIQASAKSAGLDLAASFETAIEAVAEVVQTQSAAGTTADLADTAIISQVMTATSSKLETKLTEAGFDAATVASKVTANTAVLETAKAQIQTINTAADAIISFDAAELGAIAKLAVKSGEEAAAAVTAEIATPGAGAASFTMKTAAAVETAKATAKAEVEEAQAEAAGETTDDSSSSAAVVYKPFVLASSPTDGVDWTITVAGGSSTSINTANSNNASYTVSGSTMTINLGQSFTKATVEDLLTDKADLSISLALASLPTKDDSTANTTTVTITEIGSTSVNQNGDSVLDSGEGKITASAKSTYVATSTSQTDFTFADGDPISISYTPRSGDADVAVSITNPTENIYSAKNDGTLGSEQASLELMADKFFDKLDDNSASWAKDAIMTKFITDSSDGVHISMNVADLGLYSGNTKINTVQTTLNIGNNPTTGGTVTGSARTGVTLEAAKVADLDGIAGNVTYTWQSNDSANDAAANASSDTTWTTINGAGGAVASTSGSTYTLPAKGAAGDLTGSNVRVKVTYTDGQGKAETFYSNYTDAITANNTPTGAPTISGTNTTGSVLTAEGSAIRDADGFASSAPTSIAYHWEVSANGSSGWTDIANATASTYTVAAGDGGKYIRAVATFTDNPTAGSSFATTEVVNSSASSQIVADPIFFEKESGDESGIKIGIYLDIPTLSAMTNAQGTQNHVTKLQSYTLKVNVKGSDDFSTHFEKSSFSGSDWVKVAKIADDGFDDDDNAVLNTGAGGSGSMAATFSVSSDDMANLVLLATGSYDYSQNLSIISNSSKYKLAEFRLDPQAGKSGTKVDFQFDSSDASIIVYDTGDPNNPGSLALGAYDFSITI